MFFSSMCISWSLSTPLVESEERTISREKNPELAELIDILDFFGRFLLNLNVCLSDYLC